MKQKNSSKFNQIPIYS